MSALSGTRLGPYEIVSPLGSGGMGEVYRARDTRLNRSVAIKILSPELASDPDRRARFEREAHAIAALSHPHICVVHDVGRDNGTDYLVMELLEGETLADRLGRAKARPLPMNDVLRYATEIADALDKAHRAGIVHRDLKPANIMLTKSGAKLLDFGLAKLRGPAVPISMTAIEQATTTGGPKTASGTILGTVHYMSPEQVEGREADARSDIWALGVVIYEMATGSRPFDGESAASIIGAILKDTPPPLSSRQPLAPAALDHAVAQCLAREPDERWQSAADLRGTLRWIASQSESAHGQSVGTQPHRNLWFALTSMGLLITFGLGITIGWKYFAPQVPSAPLIQFEVTAPPGANFTPAAVASTPQIAVSPDGHWLAFVAAQRRMPSQIWLRPREGRDAVPLADTKGAQFPFWSPDSRFIAFFADAKLKRIDVTGAGAAQVIADAPAGRGGSWNGDGIILFSSRPNSGVSRVPAMGGPPSSVTSVTDDAEIIGDNWPSFLPDGRHFLVYRRSANLKKMGVYLASLDDSTISPVLANNSLAVYASGHLLFVRDGSLFAIPFDQKTLRTYGEEAILGNHIGYFSGSFGYASFSVNSNGLLVYGPGVALTTSLDWFDRAGRLTGHLGKPDTYASPRIAPDQASAAVAIVGTTMAERDIWFMDLARGTASRATFDSGADWFPAWSPDHGRLFFGSTRVQVTSVFDKIGVGPDRLFGGPTITKGFATYPNDASHDGRFLACTVSTEKAYDIGILSLEDPPKLTSFLATAFNEAQARFSPNDRWLAYSSDESGAFEVYVRPFPSANAQWKISTAGGTQPEWRHDGKELFYIASDGKLMAVPVSTERAFETGTPRPLFDVDIPEIIAPYATQYAVMPDGQRFLVNTVIDQPTRPALTVNLNWTAELKK